MRAISISAILQTIASNAPGPSASSASSEVASITWYSMRSLSAAERARSMKVGLTSVARTRVPSAASRRAITPLPQATSRTAHPHAEPTAARSPDRRVAAESYCPRPCADPRRRHWLPRSRSLRRPTRRAQSARAHWIPLQGLFEGIRALVERSGLDDLEIAQQCDGCEEHDDQQDGDHDPQA